MIASTDFKTVIIQPTETTTALMVEKERSSEYKSQQNHFCVSGSNYSHVSENEHN